jgi:2-polyprenyl-6-methoxyphenol hydroxylase-like FAD-dependent oxidoreductase
MRTIGIIGGGQLGRMLAMAAARLNFRTIILEPQVDCPAAQVANGQITPPMTTRQRWNGLLPNVTSSPTNSRTFPSRSRTRWPAPCRSIRRRGSGSVAGPGERKTIPQRLRHRDRAISTPSTARMTSLNGR